MKTSTTLLLVGGIAYLGYRAKQAAESVVASIPTPPPNSGPVVNGIGFYQLDGLHGLSGFGSRLKKAAKKVTGTVQKATDNKVLRPVLAVATAGGSEMTRAAVNVSVDPKKELMRPLSPLTKRPSKNPDRTAPAAGQEVEYQDVNGTKITLAQWNAINSAMQWGNPVPTTGGWAMPFGVIYDNTSYQAYLAAQKPGSTGIVPSNYPVPSINQGTAPVQYVPKPNEDLLVTSSYSDDYSSVPRTDYTASSSGSPALPGGITTELTTPSAQEAGPAAAPESGAGKWLVGTALAAGAAYLAFA